MNSRLKWRVVASRKMSASRGRYAPRSFVVCRVFHLGRAVLAISIFGLTSCAGDGPKLYPVRGTVLLNEQPAEGASVAFHLVGGDSNAPMPSATVQADGKFTLRTHPHGEGAPASDYIVLVVWYPPSSDDTVKPKNKLPDRYASHAETPLRVTVNKGPNELEPFRLTRK